MSGITKQAGFIPVALPKIREEHKAVPLIVDTTADTVIDLSLVQSQTWIKSVRAIFVDNSQNANGLLIVADRTNQNLHIPKNAQAYLEILTGDPTRLTIVKQASGVLVPIQLLNFPVTNCVWTV